MTTQRVYTGASGQLAVMAELVMRQINVAAPYVDRGIDLFAFVEGTETLARLQIKTAQGEAYAGSEGYSAQFTIPLRHLDARDKPTTNYTLVTRQAEAFRDFLLIPRVEMQRLRRGRRRFGTLNVTAGELALRLQFRSGEVQRSEVNLTPYLNAWDRLSILHPPDLGTANGNGQA